MPASPIRKLVPLANKAKAKGTVVYHLNIGQPDLPTPEVAIEAARHLDRTVLEYSPSEGIRSFREKLVKYYHKFNIEVDVDDIIITTGGSEAVFFSFMACLDPGDEIIVPEPAYANYMAFAISCGAVIKTVPSTIEEGFALPSMEKFEELISPRTKAILICNPNNPTGYLYTQKEMDQIRDLVKKYDLFLFSDEVYREFCYTGAPYISAFHLKGIENNVVLVDSVSKRYSECGLRIGALITKNEQVRTNVMKWCQARLSPPLIGQIVAEASLDTPDTYMLEVYNEYVEILKEELLPAMGCTEPIAVAYAAAVAVQALGEKPESVEVNVSANIIKNVKSVVVPCTGGLRGIGAAVCAGIVAGCPEKELEILEEITGEQKVEMKKMLDQYPSLKDFG